MLNLGGINFVKPNEEDERKLEDAFLEEDLKGKDFADLVEMLWNLDSKE